MYKLAEGESSWSFVTNMQYKVATHACVEHENHIYVIGWDGGEKLDLATMTWENLPALPYIFHHGLAFFFNFSLYLILMEEREAVMMKLNKDNQWEITKLGVTLDLTVFPAPLLTPDILGCGEYGIKANSALTEVKIDLN